MANILSITAIVLSRTVRGGAGGNWRTINEVADPNVVRQSNPMNCGAACGEMLLREKGVSVFQDAIAGKAGAPSSAESLAAALNELDPDGTWFGSGVTEASFEGLNQTGSWAAMLFEAGARFGHWVNVVGVDRSRRLHPAKRGRLIIHDPADATRYLMDVNEFMSHWTLFSVFRR